jgi:hypothetical protein
MLKENQLCLLRRIYLLFTALFPSLALDNEFSTPIDMKSSSFSRSDAVSSTHPHWDVVLNIYAADLSSLTPYCSPSVDELLFVLKPDTSLISSTSSSCVTAPQLFPHPHDLLLPVLLPLPFVYDTILNYSKVCRFVT